jgi:hypothetical protein
MERVVAAFSVTPLPLAVFALAADVEVALAIDSASRAKASSPPDLPEPRGWACREWLVRVVLIVEVDEWDGSVGGR